MPEISSLVRLVVIADTAHSATLLTDTLRTAGIRGDVVWLPPGKVAVSRVRQTETYSDTEPPDLYFFDYSHPNERITKVLQSLAFGEHKSAVPFVLLTSPESQALLDSGEVDGGGAIMFSPTGLASFIRKMQHDNRSRFFKAVHTLYQFGPILVRTPHMMLRNRNRRQSLSA